MSLEQYTNDFLILFIMACVTSTILEYLTSYIMEKIFKARWWDYSERKLNINGRVCLENSFLFGIGGIFIMYVLNPFFVSITNRINSHFLYIGSFIFLIIFLVDVYISVYTMYKLKENSIIVNKELKEGNSIENNKKIYRGKYFKKRLLNAFPNIKNIKVYNKIDEIVKKKK